MKTIIIIANLILTLVFVAGSSKKQDSQGQAQATTISKPSATLNVSCNMVRMHFEQPMSKLERQVGVADIVFQ